MFARETAAEKSLPINRICRLLDLSKKTFYRAKAPLESPANKHKELKNKIVSIIKENTAYGYRRLKKALAEKFRININHKLLLKLLKLWGLELKRKIRMPKKSWLEKVLNFLEIRANLLWRIKKTGQVLKPFQVIVTDVTEIHYQKGKAYLCVYLDHAGKMIYGFALSHKNDTIFVLDAFKRAKSKMKRLLGRLPEKLIVHQDRGSVYTSNDYVSSVLGSEFCLSYSRKGEPGDNAVNESFFSRLKEEWRDVFFEATSFKELENLLQGAINYYNYRRYHSSIGYQKPATFIKSSINDLTKLTLQVVS
jgi:putative transposase